MNYFSIAPKENLNQIKHETYEHLEEAQRQIKLGRREVLSELRRNAETLGEVVSGSLAKGIDRVTHDTESSLKLAQSSLTRLERLLAEGQLDSAEKVEMLGAQILTTLNDADLSLDSLTEDLRCCDGVINDNFDKALRNFRQKMDLARLHFVFDANSINKELSELQDRMAQQTTGSIGSTSEGERSPLVNWLSSFADEFGPIIKALITHPDETVPKLPKDEKGRIEKST